MSPEESQLLWLVLFFAAGAALYASVGHGGASAYLAIMAIAGFSPETMRPCALWMNVAVSAVAAFSFARAGHFRARLFWPFAATSIPAAWIGGTLSVGPGLFHGLVALALAAAALRLFLPERAHSQKNPIPAAALAAGAGIGLLSGLLGVGGGIFLTPALILAGWATPKEAAAVSAPFILVNSLAALGGLAVSGSMAAEVIPGAFPLWLASVIIGGIIGSRGAGFAKWNLWMRPALGMVLLVAALKFLARAGA